jgi:hypothetical protein
VLQDPNLQARLSDTKASEEVRMLEAFFKMMQVQYCCNLPFHFVSAQW